MPLAYRADNKETRLRCLSLKNTISQIICHLEAYMHASVPPGKHCLMFVQCF